MQLLADALGFLDRNARVVRSDLLHGPERILGVGRIRGTLLVAFVLNTFRDCIKARVLVESHKPIKAPAAITEFAKPILYVARHP